MEEGGIEIHSSSKNDVANGNAEAASSAAIHATEEKGGWRAIIFILGNETFEKLASMSLIANITLYLRTQYNLEGIFLVNVVNIWSGSTNIATLLGAFISDSFLGRFHTLLYGSIFSLLGMGTMTMTAGIPGLRPPSCGQNPDDCPNPHPWQLAVLFFGLGLLVVGGGALRPCNISFGADQLDTKTAKGRSQLESFFNWWYFSFTVALVIVLTAVVYVQTNVSWLIGFSIPTLCFVASISIFIYGRNAYIRKKPRGSAFVDLAKVLRAAWLKRGQSSERASFYDPPLKEEDDCMTEKLARTDHFKCLDKAAQIVKEDELDSRGLVKDSWVLCSVQQVERLKCLLSLVPVWVSGIGCFLAMDQQNTFGILQLIQMNKSVGKHFEIPPGWMALTSMLTLSAWILIYEQVYIPQAKKFSKRKSGRLTIKRRIEIGIMMSILCMIVAGSIETKRRKSALQNGSYESPLHVILLLPQFMLSGMIEAFALVAILEFLTTTLPESMRTVGGAVFFLSLSIGSYLGSLLVNIIHLMTNKDGSSWLGGRDLNQNRLDYFYFVVAGLCTLNLIYFDLWACRFIRKTDSGNEAEQGKISDPATVNSDGAIST
ncbi:hypothetical protein MLD38_031935 [Melastoma candidum]|uniref:Uncharacterized protein n=1 Tax=Melastoma candidum TaxID=119954 RepID=A0ACB9MVU4_9MYRT|nr:hypothetical protein MLD38_031935 [Melastoma candidum]